MFMNIGNITNIKSSIINKKNCIDSHLILFFFMSLTGKSPKIFPNHKGCFIISETFALNYNFT